MSFDSAIVAHFGGDTTDLRASTEEASIMMKGFSTGASRAVNEIGQGFVGAVVFMEAVKGIRDLSSAAMDAAEQERQAAEVTGQSISDQSQAWLDLKDGIGDAKSGVVGFFTSAIGIFPAIGDGIGDMINTMRGISPEAQAQYTQMANTATETLARIKAAHDAYLKSLPAETAKVNAEMGAIDKQLADQEMNLQDKIAANLDEQARIKAQMEATNPASLAYLKEELALKQDELAMAKLQAEQDKQDQDEKAKIQELLVESDTKMVQRLNDEQKAKADTQTIDEQIVSLRALEAHYTELSAQNTSNQKDTELFLNAAAAARVEIAAKEESIRKATALSEQDQLAIFIKENPALENLNSLSDDQLKLLKLQSQEKQVQYQIDQLVGLGVDNLNAKQRDLLTALIQQNAKLQQAVDLTNQAIAGETNLGDASMQTADQMQSQADSTQQTLTAQGQMIDGAQKLSTIISNMPQYPQPPTSGGGNGGGGGGKGDKGKAPPDYSGWVHDADGKPLAQFDAKAFAGYNPNYTGFYGVGFGNQQLQDKYSASNNQAWLGGETADLQKQLMVDNNADTPAARAAVPGIEKRLQDLHMQMIGQVPLSAPNATPFAQTPSNELFQKQTDILQEIRDHLKDITGG
ncbi:MAG TPA: hypothetical protein VGG34_05145 [Opitutaceae bacterium]|jgi:hypothetical protein